MLVKDKCLLLWCMQFCASALLENGKYYLSFTVHKSEQIQAMLVMLKDRQEKAIFFLNPYMEGMDQEMVKQIKSAAHFIGLHLPKEENPQQEQEKNSQVVLHAYNELCKYGSQPQYFMIGWPKIDLKYTKENKILHIDGAVNIERFQSTLIVRERNENTITDKLNIVDPKKGSISLSVVGTARPEFVAHVLDRLNDRGFGISIPPRHRAAKEPTPEDNLEHHENEQTDNDKPLKDAPVEKKIVKSSGAKSPVYVFVSLLLLVYFCEYYPV
ncbi:hypothetical protein ENBRE01_2536 [Enteropsectra breve]|nr:hypothetical protein ENBRE01_2536 [Enteropsectra breve]